MNIDILGISELKSTGMGKFNSDDHYNYFYRQEYWSGLPFPSPGDLADPRMEPASPVLADKFFATEPPTKPL